MNGARILLAVVVLAGALLWLALAGGEGSDLERGVQETDEAFAAVEEQLVALDGDYRRLVGSEGLRLQLREQHDRLRTDLARLRDERLRLLDDPDVPRRQRLPLLRELVEDSDVLLVQVVDFRRKLGERTALHDEGGRLLAQARALRDALTAVELAEAGRARAGNQAGRLAELEQQLAAADRTLQTNHEQGALIASATLSALRTLLEDQQALWRESRPGQPLPAAP